MRKFLIVTAILLPTTSFANTVDGYDCIATDGGNTSVSVYTSASSLSDNTTITVGSVTSTTGNTSVVGGEASTTMSGAVDCAASSISVTDGSTTYSQSN